MLKIFTEKNFSIFRIFATIAIGSINIPHMHSVPVRREPEKTLVAAYNGQANNLMIHRGYI
jgi:hypothetical protein